MKNLNFLTLERVQDIKNNEVDEVSLNVGFLGQEWVEALSTALAVNTSVEIVRVGMCNRSDEWFKMIYATVMARFAQLKELNIEDNWLTKNSVEPIVDLMTSKKIKVLNMGDNSPINK